MGKRGILGLVRPHPITSPLSVLILGAGFPMGILHSKALLIFERSLSTELIPARARSVANSLKVTAGYVSVWAPACQDSIPGGHAGVGVISLKGAPLTLPTFFYP